MWYKKYVENQKKFFEFIQAKLKKAPLWNGGMDDLGPGAR